MTSTRLTGLKKLLLIEIAVHALRTEAPSFPFCFGCLFVQRHGSRIYTLKLGFVLFVLGEKGGLIGVFGLLARARLLIFPLVFPERKREPEAEREREWTAVEIQIFGKIGTYLVV